MSVIPNTYAIMEEYAEASNYRDRLHDALLGDRPFQRFRNMAQKLKVWEDWLQFRDGRFLEIALDWCAQNGIDPRAVDSAQTVPDPAPPTEDDIAPASEDILDSAAVLARQVDAPQLAVALIEAIRILFHMLDDDSFESALNQLCAAVRE